MFPIPLDEPSFLNNVFSGLQDRDGQVKGSVLEDLCPAEFSSNPDQTHLLLTFL